MHGSVLLHKLAHCVRRNICTAFDEVERKTAIPVGHIFGRLSVVYAYKMDRVKLAAVCAYAAADALVGIDDGLTAVEAAPGLAAYLLLGQTLTQILERFDGDLAVDLWRGLTRGGVDTTDADTDIIGVYGLEA